MASIVTKTGDTGMTGLYGAQRVPKDSARIQACGTVDELNAILGIVLAHTELPAMMREKINAIQHGLFRVGGDLATPLEVKAKQDRISPTHVLDLEISIVALEALLSPQKSFLLPGGTPASAHLHHARTVCRRAERLVVTLQREELINDQVLIFLNRLSDYLFVAARKMNMDAGVGDVEVKY